MNVFSKLWTVKLGDWWRGLIVAILTTPVTVLYESASKGQLTFDWKVMAAGAIAGGAGYMLKNFLTGEKGKLLSNK